MMINLLADAGIPPETVGTILGAALGSVGTWYAVRSKGKSPQQADDAQRVYLEDKFATREEVAEIKQQHRAEVADLHQRLTGITIKLNEMAGQQNMIIKILENRKSL